MMVGRAYTWLIHCHLLKKISHHLMKMMILIWRGLPLRLAHQHHLMGREKHNGTDGLFYGLGVSELRRQ